MSTVMMALQPMIIESLYDSKIAKSPLSLVDALLKTKTGFNLTFSTNPDSFCINFMDAGFVANLIAADCKKLSVACLQSLYDIEQTKFSRHSLPWNLIRFYYAAFYAANVIIKIFGTSSNWFDAKHCSYLNDISNINPSPQRFSIGGGLYTGKLSHSGREITWSKPNNGNSSGSHDALWKTFCEVLKLAEPVALREQIPSSIGQPAYLKLVEFRNSNNRQGSTIWLSQIRNEIQYRIQHGVWHATGIQERRVEKINAALRSWKADPLNIVIDHNKGADSLISFCSSCAFVLSLFKSLLVFLEDRSSSRRNNFVSMGPLAFARQVGLSLD